jgi:Copper amine oxidase N-terminal domain.
MPYVILGQETNLSTEPFLKDGKHYVPLREVVQALGGTVSYDNATKTATATISPWVATVTPNTTAVDVSGKAVTLTAPTFIEDDVLYVPYDFFYNAYGYEVTFKEGTVTIVNPNAR